MKHPYWQLVPYLRLRGVTVGLALLCTLAFTVFWPILAWLVGRVGVYIAEGNVGAIAQLAGLAAVVFLLRGAAQYGQDTLMAKAALAIVLELRTDAYTHIQQLSLDYFEEAKAGDLAYCLTEDIDRIGEAVNKAFHDFLPCILQLFVVLGYLLYLNWQLTVAATIIAPLMAVLIGAFGEQLLKFSRRSQARIANMAALLTEVFAGIRLVRAFQAEAYEIRRFRQIARENRQARFLAEKLKALQFVVVGFLEAMSVLLLCFLGAWQIRSGNLTGAEFLSYVAGVALLIDPIAHVTDNYNLFKQSEASLDRVFALFTLPPGVGDRPQAQILPPVTGKVEFHQVSFAYTTSPGWVLADLNFTVCPGESIALVGASGAGKSTVVNLLLRFYDPQQGQILLDGVDIRSVTLDSLRRQIGIVPQDTLLFSGTIAQNIAFGQNPFDLAAVEAAAKVANAHDFITQLPQGYLTPVGERGTTLSGGQRQRIAIARAVLFDPRLLILDEATSALDAESESLVQQALERLTRNRTVLAIAHRLATLRNCDRILVMDKGRIVETGTHEELLERDRHYARIWAKQFADS